MKRGAARSAAALVALCACGPSPQAKDEASITYRIKFSAEAGVSTRVIFPIPLGADQSPLMMAIAVSDGGTVTYIQQTTEGLGTALDGHGVAEAIFSVKNLRGFPEGTGAPDVALSMQQPDAGPGDLYLRVNKGGNAIANVEFEYTATRDCGNGCGGKKSWTYVDTVGLGLQPVTMNYVEEKR